MSTAKLQEECAEALLAARDRAKGLTAFVGLDGFVDDILKVVDKRESAESYQPIRTISALAERIAGAEGKSTNMEVVRQRTKLGGNGPIMANALATLDVRTTYVGALGFPILHSVFEEFARRAEVHSISEPGYTNALEFEDGKVMLVRSLPLNEITWPIIQERFGRENFVRHFQAADLIGFVNWTMIPYLSGMWEALLKELCPSLSGEKRFLFFDLADPEKRNNKDIVQALDLIREFQKYFKVILGLNEKEASEIGEVLRLPAAARSEASSRDELTALAREIYAKLSIDTLVLHPVAYALTCDETGDTVIDGPYTASPLITTGAGDHFNAGFCFGRLLGLDNRLSLLTGVATSGFYVRTAKSPKVEDLASLLRDWHEDS